MFAALVSNRWSFFNDTSVCLILVLSAMAFLISPVCPWGSHRKLISDVICAFYLPAMLLSEIVYEMVFSPGIISRYGPGQFHWFINAGIYNAFAFAFAVRLARIAKGWLRLEG